MSTTVQVSKEVKDAVAAVRSEMSAYLFAKIDETATVVLDRRRKDGLAELVKSLPDDGCRYVFLDFAFTTRAGSPRDSLVLISWSPVVADADDKTRHALASAEFSRSLGCRHWRLRASSPEELEDGLTGIRDSTP